MEGKSVFDVIKSIPESEKNSLSILTIFEKSGEMLAKLHNHIQFDSFYDKIYEIGSDKKNSWAELFKNQWEKNINDAKQYAAIQPLLEDLNEFYKDTLGLVEDDTEAVLFHNDYQIQNIIIKENQTLGYKSPEKFEISGLIDFDNWRVGPRAQDFVKMEYWSIKDNEKWKDAFYRGYSSLFPIKSEMKTKIKVYKVLWFVLVYAFEMDKITKNEANIKVDERFPSAQIYIDEIEKILCSGRYGEAPFPF